MNDMECALVQTTFKCNIILNVATFLDGYYVGYYWFKWAFRALWIFAVMLMLVAGCVGVNHIRLVPSLSAIVVRSTPPLPPIVLNWIGRARAPDYVRRVNYCQDHRHNTGHSRSQICNHTPPQRTLRPIMMQRSCMARTVYHRRKH